MTKKPSIKTIPPKPPVVTIMGHVDHGKTTLLDSIRHSKITAGEAGGITQHIGAYQVEHQGKKITFIDTPGHAAFSQMRAHGASVTDIAILVVAADDGVKPQTKESIKHIQSAHVLLIVAINKIDTPGSSPDMVKAELTEEGILVEGYGGNTPVVNISALKGEGIDKLLETILIFAEVEELVADPDAPLKAVVIESHQKKNLGPTATLLVKQGTLNLGDKLISVAFKPAITGSAKKLLTNTRQELLTAPPSTPVEIIGLKELPPVGLTFTKLGFESAVSVADTTPKTEPKVVEAPSQEPSTETQEAEVQAPKTNINLILVADTQGTLDAIAQNFSEEITLIRSSIGEVTESDILLAQNTKSVIIAFSAKITPSAKKLAEIEKVIIKPYNIIYKLLEDLESQILLLLEPTMNEQEVGVASVKAVFNTSNGIVAGCEVDSGQLTINAPVHLKRKDVIVADAKISSLRHQKDSVSTAKAGTNCGLVLKPSLDIKVGDKLISYKKQES